MVALTLFLLCSTCINKPTVMMKEAVQEIGNHANMMPRERGITLPLVNVEGGTVIIRRLIYYTRLVPGEGTFITPPQYVAEYDLSNRRFVSLKRFELELPDLPAPPWIHNRPAFKNAADIIPEFNRIWDLYDVLIPAYVQSVSMEDGRLRSAAIDYLKYFKKHAEVPLLPYYLHFSGHFLEWVQAVARREQ